MSSQNREDSDVSHKLVKDCGNAVVSRAKAVFCRSADGGTKDSLLTPGTEGVHALLTTVNDAITLQDIRRV